MNFDRYYCSFELSKFQPWLIRPTLIEAWCVIRPLRFGWKNHCRAIAIISLSNWVREAPHPSTKSNITKSLPQIIRKRIWKGHTIMRNWHTSKKQLDDSRINYTRMSDRDETVDEPSTTSPFIEQEIPQPDSSSRDVISDAPRANDILCAKGKRSFDHVGNRKFRSWIAFHYQAYSNTRNRSEKSSLIRSIVTHLVQEKGCRFLKRKSKNDHWYDIGFKGAECKVAHSFRDARSDRNKSIYKLHQLVRQVVSQPLLVPLTPTSPREINNMEVYQEQSSPADQLSNVSYAVRRYHYYPQVSPPVGSCCCSRALDDFNEMSLSDLEESLHNGIIRSNDITTLSIIQSTNLNDKIECSCQVK